MVSPVSSASAFLADSQLPWLYQRDLEIGTYWDHMDWRIDLGHFSLGGKLQIVVN